MAVINIIKLSELEGAKRIDAEYYQPEYLEVKNKLLKTNATYFKNLVREIIHPKEIKREYEEEEKDYLFLLAQNVRPLMLDLSERKYISSKTALSLQKNLLEIGDLLFVRTGAIGDVTAYTGKPRNVVASSHILIAKPNFRTSPFYLAVFFNTKLGKKIIIRGNYGAVQPEISPEHVKTIPVPILNQDLIECVEKKFLQAQELSEQSQSLYSQAESLLLSELGLQDFKPEDRLFYKVSFSKASTVHRIDAEYFKPKYEEIFDFIKCPIKRLGEITKFLNHAKQPPYVENGEIPIITQKHLGKAFLNLDFIKDSETKFTSEEWLNKNLDYRLRIGDVLYYSVGAYIGKTNIVLDEIKATAASFITIIRPTDEVNSAYLTVVLNSIVGQLQSEKWQSATAQQYIYPKDIKNFIIPILPKSIQQEIANLVQKSHEARRKAEQLLEEAKKMVEDAIEKQG